MTRLSEPSLGEGLIQTLEALSASGLAAFRYAPASDRLSLAGALGPLGLSALAPRCALGALQSLLTDEDLHLVETFRRPGAPGAPFDLRLSLADGGRVLAWRGSWLESGDVSGVIEGAAARSDARDPLTGLLSRAGFIAAADERLAAGSRHHLLAADVARLRRLNEALGSDGADLVLQALAQRLERAFPGRLAARVGEDEFAVLLGDSSEGADNVASLRRALERPLRVSGFDIHPSLWIAECLCEGGQGAPSAKEYLRRVSLALEAQRSAGQTPLAAVRPAGVDGLLRLALEADLHGALERGEITPFYQPIAHLGTGRLAGFEALARWQHPTRGLIMPDQFLPLMAEAGLMRALGRAMMTAAARQIGVWRRTHPVAGDLFVAVNLSTGELEDEQLVGFVAERVSQNALAPGALKLEITESDVMRDPERAAVVLAELGRAGAAISLDDFGTGFSSLAYLTRLPFETLKIDRYFVRTMAENEGSAKIVRSVASLGRDLGLEVVAEGVETLAVARQLHAMGCVYGQGFGYSPALDAQAAEVYLNESYLDDGAPIRISA